MAKADKKRKRPDEIGKGEIKFLCMIIGLYMLHCISYWTTTLSVVAVVNGIWFSVCSLMTVAYVWWNKRPADWVAKGITTLTLILLTVTEFYFPARWTLLVYMAVSMLLIVALFIYIGRAPTSGGIHKSVWILILVKPFCMLLPHSFRYTYESHMWFPFWQVCLAIGVCASLFVTIKCFSNGKNLWQPIVFFVVIAILLTWCLGACCSMLNHTLDMSEPQMIEATIIGHHSKRGGYKSGGAYLFMVTLDGGTYNFVVPYKEYCQYQDGDAYRIYRYEGAFGQPFYLAEAYAMP
jgi:hypothetical protein